MSTTRDSRPVLLLAGLAGATAVALGALGAHRLEPLLAEKGMTHAWDTGSRYHLVHALALLAAAAWLRTGGNGAVNWAARLWAVGILLFSGSLYWFALGGPHSLVYVTPLGGVALIAGWILVVAAALRDDSRP
jgi:uncharacterized membrane protein YgdD (TMEM256/DUF423 family)